LPNEVGVAATQRNMGKISGWLAGWLAGTAKKAFENRLGGIVRLHSNYNLLFFQPTKNI
jgi:hypothetical protein